MGVLTQSPGHGRWRQDKDGAIAALAQEERGHVAEWLVPSQQVEGTWRLESLGNLEIPKRNPALVSYLSPCSAL